MNGQLDIFDNHTSSQIERLMDLLRQRPVTCEDTDLLGIAGSALPRRIKDARERYNVAIDIKKKEIVSAFSNKKVKISQYVLVK